MNANINLREDIFLAGKEIHYDENIYVIIKENENFTSWRRYEVHDQGVFLQRASKIPFFNTLEDAVQDLSYYA